MKERPILFQGAMVRALLAGTKTQTRRAVKLPHMNPLGQWEPMTVGGPEGGRTRAGRTIPAQQSIWHTRTGDSLLCPYGQPGDRLWVRETWQAVNGNDRARRICESPRPDFGWVEYAATPRPDEPAYKWRPSIFMPRWASRILLEVTGVRVERLQAISEADSAAEGLTFSAAARRSPGCMGIYELRMPDGKTHFDDNACNLYRKLWEQINGAGSWDANPWVWVVEFKRVTP